MSSVFPTMILDTWCDTMTFQMGNTALMYAAHSDHSHCANELLDHGADLTISNVDGASAFSIAVNRGSKQGGSTGMECTVP